VSVTFCIQQNLLGIYKYYRQTITSLVKSYILKINNFLHAGSRNRVELRSKTCYSLTMKVETSVTWKHME
jgi:hypothetical protein